MTQPSFADFCMTLDDCRYRLAFLQDAFGQNPPNSIQDRFEFTVDGQNGLISILGAIQGDIKAAENMAGAILHRKEVPHA